MSGFWKTGVEYHFLGLHIALESLIRDAIFVTAAILSLILTKKEYREANQFSWEPILEVGKLFFGIFVTIVPVLEMLRAGSSGAFAPVVVLGDRSRRTACQRRLLLADRYALQLPGYTLRHTWLSSTWPAAILPTS